MERDTVLGIADFGLATLQGYAAKTPGGADDFVARQLLFLRKDPFVIEKIDEFFADDEAQQLVEPEMQSLRERAERVRDGAEDLTADEFITTWLPMILKVVSAIREHRQKKKAAGAPEAA